MIIFTGTGRSGTNFLAHWFGAHHEYNVKQLLGQLRSLPDAYNPKADILADRRVRRTIMEAHLAGVELSEFRDSSNIYIHFLDVLADMDPDIRTVLCVRDGRDFVRSAVGRKWHMPDGHGRLTGLRERLRGMAGSIGYHPPGRYRTFLHRPARDDPWFASWPSMSPIERMAWLWQWRNQKALDRLASVDAQKWMITRLEDLRDDEGEMARVEDFLGVTPKHNGSTKSRRNETKSPLAVPEFPEWSAADKEGFMRIAGGMMGRFGYKID